MNRLFFVASTLILALPVSGQSATILETALPGAVSSSGGTVISGSQFLGARFSVNGPTQITAVGAHVGTSNLNPNSTFFAAIVKVATSSTMPVAGTYTDQTAAFNLPDVMGTVVFGVQPGGSQHISIPFPLVVGSGNYVLTIGSGLFGASGSGYMPKNNPKKPGQPPPIGWWDTFENPKRWQWNAIILTDEALRFVVEGVAVPEPTAAELTIFGLIACVAASPACRRRQ